MTYEVAQDTILVDTATGDKYVRNQAGLTQTGSGGAAHVTITSGGNAFTPSSYTGRISSSEDGTTFAIATGATRLLLQSLEVTGVEEYAVLAFGTSAADAQTNLAKTGSTPNIISNAGVIVKSGDSTAGGAAPDLIVRIPANATHAALGNGVAGLVQIVMVTQGI